MPSQSQMPIFKQGDLIRSTIALPITYTLYTHRVSKVLGTNNIRWFSVQNIPVDRSAVQGLPIKSGVVFEVDAVLPWEAPEEHSSKQYRLVLNPRHLEQLDEPDRQRSKAEFSSLQIILAEEDSNFPFFYTFADEENLELVKACDGRNSDNPIVKAWNADNYFPWGIRLQFPTADEVLNYEIEARLYENSDQSEDALEFWLSLRPIYVRESEMETLLSLHVTLSNVLDDDIPQIEFQSERNAVCQLNPAKQEINIFIQFRILVDLERSRWRYAEDNSSGVNFG